MVFLVAMDTLLSWQQKQMVITLLFEDIQTSYLVQMFLEVIFQKTVKELVCVYLLKYNITTHISEIMYFIIIDQSIGKV